MDLFWTIYLIDISKHIALFPFWIASIMCIWLMYAVLTEDSNLFETSLKVGCLLIILSIPISIFAPSREALALMYVADTVTIQDIKELLEFIKNVK